MSNDFANTDSAIYTSSDVNDSLRLSTDSGQGMDITTTTTDSQQQLNQTTDSSNNGQKKNEHVSRSKKAVS